MNDRLDNVLTRQKKHLVRDTLAVFVLVLAIAAAVLLVAFQTPAAPADVRANDAVLLVDNNMTPAQITARHLAARPNLAP